MKLNKLNMKRKSLLLMLLLVLLAPWAAKADVLTVADETGTNGTIPIYGFYSDDNYQHTQTIYPASMLTEMQNSQITKLTYYLQSAGETTLTSTYEVRLGTTTQSSFNTGEVNYISMTGTANYSGTLNVTNSSMLVEITLTTPYTYTSGNLVVDVRLVTKASGYTSTTFLGASGSTCHSIQSMNGSTQPPFSQGSAVTFMPKTTFTYTYVGAGVTCTPSFSSSSDYITNFSLGSINNSTGFSSGGYGSYTNLITNLQAGTTATASLSSSSGSGNHGAAVWIDFNDDGTFDSSTERVGTYGNSIQPSTTVQINLSIPSDAAAGRHTLRVVYRWNTAGTSIDPCVSASYGEGEDYTVNILPGPPTGLAANDITQNSAQISWTGQSSSYTVWYGGYEHQTILSQGFEGGSMPSGWSTETGSENGNYWTVATGRNDGNDGEFTAPIRAATML